MTCLCIFSWDHLRSRDRPATLVWKRGLPKLPRTTSNHLLKNSVFKESVIRCLQKCLSPESQRLHTAMHHTTSRIFRQLVCSSPFRHAHIPTSTDPLPEVPHQPIDHLAGGQTGCLAGRRRHRRDPSHRALHAAWIIDGVRRRTVDGRRRTVERPRF